MFDYHLYLHYTGSRIARATYSLVHEKFVYFSIKKVLASFTRALYYLVFPCTGRNVLLNLFTALFYNNFLIDELYHDT